MRLALGGRSKDCRRAPFMIEETYFIKALYTGIIHAIMSNE